MILFYVPCPSAEVADGLADTLLSEGLIACANRLAPMQSRFIWKGEIQSEAEVPLLLKTSELCAAQTEERILALHPYETPAVLRVPLQANAEFEKWIGAVTAPE